MPESREWEDLRTELEAVAAAAHAFNAYVFDAWDNLWCSAHNFSAVCREDLTDFVHAAAARNGTPLPRGGKLDECISGPKGYVYLRTYASCYVLLLRFAGRFDRPKTRDVARSAPPGVTELRPALEAVVKETRYGRAAR